MISVSRNQLAHWTFPAIRGACLSHLFVELVYSPIRLLKFVKTESRQY